MSKIFAYRRISSLLTPSFRFPRLIPSQTSFFATKQQEKTQKKLEKEKLYENVGNLETMADQEDLTQEAIKRLIEETRQDMQDIISETTIPTNALITAGIITLPVLIGGPLLNIFCMQNLMLGYLPASLMAYLKYSAVHLNFMAGIHWGFAISEHNLQLDSINSTKEIRRLFVAASIPMFLSFGLVSSLVYSAGMSVPLKCLHIGGLILTHLYVLALDNYVVKNKIAPKWFLKIKVLCSLLSIVGLASLLAVFANHEEKVQEKKNAYRRFLETNQARINLKPIPPKSN